MSLAGHAFHARWTPSVVVQHPGWPSFSYTWRDFSKCSPSGSRTTLGYMVSDIHLRKALSAAGFAQRSREGLAWPPPGRGVRGGTAPPGIARTEQRERSRGAGTCPRLRRDPTTVCCFLLLLVYAGGSALSKLPPHYVGGAPETQNDACFLSLSEPRADCRGMLSPPLVS